MCKNHKSNIELINHLMEFSKYGALMQLLIMDAVKTHAMIIAQASDQELDNPVVSVTAWRGVAIELLEAMIEFQGYNIVIPEAKTEPPALKH